MPKTSSMGYRSATEITKIQHGKFFGIAGPVPIAFLLFLSLFCLLVLNSRNKEIRSSNNHGFQMEKQHASNWQEYLANFQKAWNHLQIANTDHPNSPCSYENYIFGQSVDQADPCLVEAFKNKLLLKPPPSTEQTNIMPNITDELPTNQEKFSFIKKLLIDNEKTSSGFFIECGANDGSFISPTIRLEKTYNWTGLLIEANPIPFKTLLTKKRNAYAVNTAACITQHPTQITFYTNPNNTGISGLNQRKEYGVSTNITVPCIPLYTMLKATNIQIVDYFSLDVEGLELAILKTVPYDKVIFKVLTVEYGLIPGKQQALDAFLSEQGYKFVKQLNDYLTVDSLYVHASLYPKAKKIIKENIQ